MIRPNGHWWPRSRSACTAPGLDSDRRTDGGVRRPDGPGLLAENLRRRPGALAALKNLTSELVGRFCVAAQDATRAACGDADGRSRGPDGLRSGQSSVDLGSAGPGLAVRSGGQSSVDLGSAGRLAGSGGPGPRARDGGRKLTRYACDLVVPRTQRLECALLKAVAAHYVMTREGAAAAQARERELIAELAATVQIGAPRTLDPVFRPAWDAAPSDAARRRVMIDQIASLTDTSAIAWHRRLCRTTAPS